MIVLLLLLAPITYFSLKWLHQHYFTHTLFNPILFSILIIACLLIWGEVSYQDYVRSNQLFFGLLDLAIVALAIPLYKEFRTIKNDTWRFLLCSVAGVITSSLSAMLVAFSFGAGTELMVSLAPNAVTTPIAIEVSEQLNGIGALSAVVVICVGIFGAIFGLPLLTLFNVKAPRSRGLALGAACHAVGTAKAIEVDSTTGAFASVSLVLSAILTPVLIPIIYTLLTLMLDI